VTSNACCSIVELRQYTLHDNARDALIALFDGRLIEPQERDGMHVIGQFRDCDDPRMFVWLRGFTDMDSRAAALEAFYRGPVWREHRDAANATMVDSDNVLLLRPTGPGSGLPHPPPTRPGLDAPTGSMDEPTHVIDVYPPSVAIAEATTRLREAGLQPLAWYETEPSENTFPALPVREGERVVVSLSAVVRPDGAAGDPPADVVQRIRCSPTGRSQLNAG